MNAIFPAVLLLISGVNSRFLKCPKSSGKFPIENSLCKSYYECENWKIGSERRCPPEQNFNPVSQKCDYEELYYCAEALQKYKLCKKPKGKFPKENSFCRSYYQCKKWQVIAEFTCPPGQNFNPEQQWCDWEEIYPCLEDKPSTNCPKSTGLFPKPGSQCKSFYQCINRKAFELQCPGDLNFNPLLGQCELPELYSCDEMEENTTPVAAKTTWIISTTPQETFTTEETVRTTKGYSTASSEETKVDTETEGTSSITKDVIPVFTTETIWSTKTEGTVGSQGTETEGIVGSQSTETERTVGPHSTETERTIGPHNTKTEGTVGTTIGFTTTGSSAVFSTEGSSSVTTKRIPQNTETERTTEDYTFTAGENTRDTKTEGTDVTTEEYSTFSKDEGSSETETEGSGITTSPDRETEEVTVLTEGYTTLPTERTSPGRETRGTSGTSKEYTISLTEKTSEETAGTSERDTKHSTELTVSGSETEETVSSTASEAKSTVTKTGTASLLTRVPGEVVCPGSDGLFPHPTNKHKFLSCLNFVPTVMSCPSDLIYEPMLEACIWNRGNLL